MENKFKESRFIEQVMVVGEGQKMPGAFIVPEFEALKIWCGANAINYSDDADLIEHPKIIEKYESEINFYNNQFANYQQVKKFVLMKESWSVDGGELTATLKLKRKPIMQKYFTDYNKIYN